MSSDGTSSCREAWQLPKQVGGKLWLSAATEVPAGPGPDSSPDRAESSSPQVSPSAPLLLVLLGAVFRGSSPPTLNCFLVLPRISELALVVGSPCLRSPSGDCLFSTVFSCLILLHSRLYLSLSLAMVDKYRCRKIVPHTEQLKPPHTSHLAAPVSREHRHGLAGLCTRAHSGCPAGQGSHSEAGLGKVPFQARSPVGRIHSLTAGELKASASSCSTA